MDLDIPSGKRAPLRLLTGSLHISLSFHDPVITSLNVVITFLVYEEACGSI